jgi:pimeloyl-ACP methyl ester carboxylesterase
MRNVLLRAVPVAVAGAICLFLGAPCGWANVLIFKDRFVLEGTTKRSSQPLVDPSSGAHFIVPSEGGFYTITDGVRNTFFSPGQVQEIMSDDPGRPTKPLAYSAPAPRMIGVPLPTPWTIERLDPWERWKRKVILDSSRGRLDIEQRLTLLTPQRARVDGYHVDWVAYYLTRELGVDTLHTLLRQYLDKTKDSEPDKRLQTSKFLIQAGYPDEAEKDLKDLVKDFPDQKDKAEPLTKTVKEMQAQSFIEATERARNVGQYADVRDRLARFPKLGLTPNTSEKLSIRLQALKNKQQEDDEKLKRARHFLENFSRRVPKPDRDWMAEASAAILAELNLDTLPRLEIFLGQAPAHERELQQKQKPAQGTEELLALAVSSWILGGAGGETKPATARELWQTRKFLLEYLKTDSVAVRRKLLASRESSARTGLDEIARMLPFLPPVQPYDRINTAPFRLETSDPDGQGDSTYLVQLPPEYHHYRPYPVLIVLHQGDEKPLDMLNRWSQIAAENGYILVAPEWNGGKGMTYGYSAREHATVLAALRDVRRRFQIDSDRVLLFGYGQGGLMAYDVGLSHPDLFAGVMPMAAAPSYFPGKYATNAQLLPFYVVGGDRTGTASKENRALFKEWVRWNYPSFYVEYKGRGVEWFGGELPRMLDWMSRRKRAHPLRALGRVNYGGGTGEEFRTMRLTDHRFYWLEGEVQPRHVNDADRWNSRLAPATLQANIFSANQIHLHTTGISQATIWLGPNMIDFTKPVSFRINSSSSGPVPVRATLDTLLEDVYQRGDRQQLYFARLTVKT